ncbi:major tail protein [Oenococcus alcoholitolerans]|uniref:major tail protein n=1 Tax=Oenococcus alcoholitolerans TaxID=931074 RepID=UPI003F713A35
MTATTNKTTFGLKNVVIFPATDDGSKITYSSPFAYKGAVELQLSAEGTAAQLYADDGLYINLSNNQGYSGKLTMADLSDAFREQILDEKVDTNGNHVERDDAIMSPFGMAFEVKGDSQNRRMILFNCSVSARPDVKTQSKEDKITFNNPELDFNSVPDYNHQVKTWGPATDQDVQTWASSILTPTTSTPAGQ